MRQNLNKNVKRALMTLVSLTLLQITCFSLDSTTNKPHRLAKKAYQK